MIKITNLCKNFGSQELFNDINLQVTPKQKIGLIGRNGSGKSTLFKIILGEEGCDDGEIIVPKNYKIGTLKQHLEFSKPTIKEECEQILSEDEKYNFYKIEKILFGLGFSSEDLEKNPLSFSGGFQIRINLAKLLGTEPNMLLLDEPTNYLDIISLRWLKQFIKEFDGEVILITHDREFMDSVTTHTMGIQRKNINIIQGNTHKYYETLKLQDETYEKTRQNEEKKRKELEDFIARNKARASTAAQAQSKAKALEKMGKKEALENENTISFKFNYKTTPAKITLRAENLGFGYDENNPLFQKLNFSLENSKVLAIIGKNGKGKSTLLNYIANELPKQQGEINFHPSTTIAHFGQTNIQRLNQLQTIEEEITSVGENMSIAEVRNICGTMMFTGELAEKKVAVLSGGEKSRVMLGKIIASPSNLLLLDEPTNHLDMYSIDALCEAIENFKGAVIMVTHSEMLLRRLADSLIIFHKNGAEFFDDNYDEFLNKIGWEEEDNNTTKKPKEKKQILSHNEKKKLRSSYINLRSKESSPLKKKIKSCEEKIIELEELLEEQNNLLMEASNRGDNSGIMEFSKRVGTIQNEIDELFEELEVATISLEEIEEKYQLKLDELE